MKRQYLSELCEGAPVDSQFAVRSRDLRVTRTGNAYLAMELSDRTGVMPAVMFRPGPGEWSLPLGTAATVRGVVTTYRGVKRISVEAMRPAADYDRRDMLPAGSRKQAELVAVLDALIARIEHPGLRHVVDSVLGAPSLSGRFRDCPASRQQHHAYVGGLLEHTVAVTSLCRVLALRYDGIDGDLLVAGALLHDVGTVEELTYETTIELTDAGRLLGHVLLGQRIVSAAIDTAGEGLPSALGLRLLHLVASHHGEAEQGTPALPALLESVVLHQADEIDAQAAGFMQAVAGTAVMDERWTGSDNPFGRPLCVPATEGVPTRRALGSARG
jgi:3'-5' exoribonuclease